jgi:D-alanine--poly(phosphoribitol) ligase subunit 1
VSGTRRLSYGELRQRSDALAAYLADTLPDDRAPVAVVGHKEPDVLVAMVAATKVGRPYVPIDSVLPAARIARIVDVAGCATTLIPETIAQLAEGSARPPARTLAPDDPYYIMFTSGSTGDPKGVVITAGCLASFLDWMLAEHHFAPGEVFLNQVSYSFDVSVMDTYTALLTGGTVFSVGADDVRNPKQLYASLQASGVTTWVSTPSFAAMCLAERRFTEAMLPAVRRFLFCGEALPPAVATQLLDRFPRAEVWNTYGPTETTVAVTSLRLNRDILARYPRVPIGYPMPGVRIAIMGNDGGEVVGGERGEIVIAGPTVSPGYVAQPDLTARAFTVLDAMRAYRTGDWGYLQDGMLFCEGRMDDQIKLHGHRVELGDVEANLRRVAGVRDAVVLPVMKDSRVDSLAAFVVLSTRPPGSDFDVSRSLRAELATRVPAYMLPRRFVFLERLPMTTNGKADRRQLAALLS